MDTFLSNQNFSPPDIIWHNIRKDTNCRHINCKVNVSAFFM